MSEKYDVMSIKIPQQSAIDKYASLAQLQSDMAALAKQQEKLAELQKQQLRQTLNCEVAQGIQQLTFLADRINALGKKQPILHCWRPLCIWQVHHSSVPAVVKQRAVFVLTAKIVDLFQSERERDFQRLAEAPQRRRKAFESWLAERRRF